MVEQSEFPNKLEYIARHKDEILPTSSHADEIKAIYTLVQDVEEHHGGVWRFADKAKIPQPNVVEAILQEAETKVFVWANPDADADAKRVVFTMDNPGAFAALTPVVFALKHSARCKSIELIASNTAAEYTRENEGGAWFGFRQIRSTNIAPGKPTPVFVDILASGDAPADVVFASFTTSNGPETAALFSGKSVWGAKKLYFVVDAWGGFGKTLANQEHMDKVDGIFCNDAFAKKILEKELPDFPKEKIYPTGTGQIDSLELERADEISRTGREKLGVNKDAIGVLYIGDISPDYNTIMPNPDPDISEKTFANVLNALVRCASDNEGIGYALLVRPHPRGSRSNELWQRIADTKLPENLQVVRATKDNCSINEAAYAADVIGSILSTENFKAPLRGRTGVFFGFAEPGMGKDALEHMYSSEILDAVREMPGLAIVSSDEELADWLSKQQRAITPEKDNADAKTASEQIIEIALS